MKRHILLLLDFSRFRLFRQVIGKLVVDIFGIGKSYMSDSCRLKLYKRSREMLPLTSARKRIMFNGGRLGLYFFDIEVEDNMK